MHPFDCPVCGDEKPPSRRRFGTTLATPLVRVLERTRTGWSPAQDVCADCVADAKVEHMQHQPDLGVFRTLPDDHFRAHQRGRGVDGWVAGSHHHHGLGP